MASSPTQSEISLAGLSPSRNGSPLRVRGNWSRSGCVTCKKRRKKCDEQKPKCGNCIRLGRDCEGYSNLWITLLSTTTTTFQQHRVSETKRRKLSKACRDDEDSHSVSLELTPISSPSENIGWTSHPSTPGSITFPDASRTNDNINDLTVISNHGFILEDSITHLPTSVQPREAFYMQYHVERVSHLVLNLQMERNPLNEVLIPRALSSPLLLNALCLLSAGHMRSWESPNKNSLQKAEMTYYGKTLSGIRNALTELSELVFMSPAYVTLLEAVLATVASLCKYEAVRGSVRSWRGHLEAMQRLVISCGGLTNLDRDIADWLSGLLIYFQYMSNLITPTPVQGLVCEGLYTTPKIDIYLGCSEQMVKVCSRIADLRSVNDFGLLKREIVDINAYLTNWSCREQSFIIPEGITEETIDRLEMVANFFRYAAFVFLHSILDRMSWPTTTTNVVASSDTWNKLRSQMSHSKPQALENIISLLQSHPPDHHTEFSALTFPLFVAGCECEGKEEHLSLILGALRTLEVNFGIRNTTRAQEMIELYWSLHSSRPRRHWLDILKDMDWDLLLV